MKRSSVLMAGLLLITAGCSILPDPGPSSTLTIAPPVNPYQSTTKTAVPIATTTPVSTEQPLIPTPTPFIHTIQAGDTLYGLALLYNISFDRLVTANPGLNPNSLTVGTEVIIPLGEEDDLPPTPTPYPLPIEDPACYPTTDGGLWCFALVANNQSISLENLSLAFNIYDTDHELIRSLRAFPLLDIIHPGQSFPVGVLIQGSTADQGQISTSLLTAYPSDLTEPQVLITDYSFEFFQDNTVAQIDGIFEILSGESKGDQVWIVGVGLSEGKPVGVRKWVSDGDLGPEVTYPFDFLIYSLGPQIDQIQLFSELH